MKLTDIAKWARARFLKLSALDGKPGLTLADFKIAVGWVEDASTTGKTGKQKAAAVAKQINAQFGSKIPSWVLDQLVSYSYDFAQQMGTTKK